jgi:hypothetical protein
MAMMSAFEGLVPTGTGAREQHNRLKPKQVLGQLRGDKLQCRDAFSKLNPNANP